MRIEKAVTDKVIAANRKNAKSSTGPRSASDKSAGKYNALTHGLLTKSLLFEKDEEEAEFQTFAARLEQQLKPTSMLQEMAVEDIAVSSWKLHTAQRLQLRSLRTRQKTSNTILEAFR